MAAGTFTEEIFGFSGPGRGIVNIGETDEKVLPVTDGDATINLEEETFEVTKDETGKTPRQVFRLGQKLTVTYPMKTADMDAFALATRGDLVQVGTVSPSGTVGTGSALAARTTIQAPAASAMIAQKKAFTFDFFRITQPVFDEGGDTVVRTTDLDKWGLRLDNAIFGPNGEVYKNNNGESAFALKITGVCPLSTDKLYRFFNTDLAVAS
jgi:hypothetical protein